MNKREVALRLANILAEDRLVAFAALPIGEVPCNISFGDKSIILEALREYGGKQVELSIRIADLPEIKKVISRLAAAETLIRRIAEERWPNIAGDKFKALARRWINPHAECDCQAPEVTNGAAVVSEDCPIHGWESGSREDARTP